MQFPPKHHIQHVDTLVSVASMLRSYAERCSRRVTPSSKAAKGVTTRSTFKRRTHDYRGTAA